MNLGEVKDIVRDGVGQVALPLHQMDFALGAARRNVEKNHNFYWMEATKDFNLVIDQSSYSITTAAAGGLNLPNYKDLKVLLEKEPGTALWNEVELSDLQQTSLIYAVDDVGEPERAAIENASLFIFPPKPDQSYNMRLHHWQWTSNPTGNTLTDELLTRFPELLIYATNYFVLSAHGLAEAGPWKQLFDEEFVRVKRMTDDRHGAQRINFTPRRGPFEYR